MTESDHPPSPSLDTDPEIVALRELDAQLAESGQVALSAVTIEHLKIVFGTTASFNAQNKAAGPMLALLEAAIPNMPFGVGADLAALVRAEIAETIAYAVQPKRTIELTPELIAAVAEAAKAQRAEPEAA